MAFEALSRCAKTVTPYLLFLIFVSTLGPLQFGFHLSELNAPQDVITCQNPSLAEDVASKPDARLPQCIPMTEAQFASLSSFYVLGGFGGAITAGPTSTRYGRLLAMRITSILFIFGACFETLAASVPILAFGRFLAGIGAGASTVIVPLYISEIAPPTERGLFGSMTQVTINVGLLITQILGYYLSKGSLWRLILAAGAGIALLQAFGLMFLPESPAWIARYGEDNGGAVSILRRIRGNDDLSDEIIQWNIDEVQAGGEQEPLMGQDPAIHKYHAAPGPVGFYGVLRDPLYRPALIAVIGIMFAQQLCGINSIMMYSVSLLRGVLPLSSPLITILISVVNLATTVACSPLPDTIGRKTCLLISIGGMGTSSVLLALSLRWEAKLLSAISVLLFVAFFATGLGPVPFLMASEFVGPEARGSIQSWSLGANYVATFLVAQFFPLINTGLNERFGGKGWAYFLFGGFAALSFLFVSWRVPETMGKKDADEVWGRQKDMID